MLAEKTWKLLLVATVAAGCAGEIASEDVEGSDDALIHGTLTTERPEIGKVVVPSSACTGTLIAPNVVLTAAHCFGYRSSKNAGGMSFLVYTTQTSFKRYRISEYVSLGTSPWFDDVALARLSSPVPALVATPASMARSRPADGTPLSMYGFGKVSRANTRDANDPKNYRKRRFDFVQGEVTQELAEGDSGGPVIDRDTGAIVATISGYVRSTGVDVFSDLIAFEARIADRVAAWTGTAPCGGWEPFTEWTCSTDGVRRGRCGAAGLEIETCPTACEPGSDGAQCQ